jgi:protein CLEC16A
MQLIQTTSIFLINIEQPTHKFYILCHPFLNKLISFNFNFYDEELVDIYIPFIKSLAI